MSSVPKLSVITTLYNGEKFVEDSLQSALNQTYTDFEWIIANDGSTDATWDIVNDLVGKDERVRLVDDKNNIKIPRRRNQAIELARGKYIAIHDGDDISLPHRFEREVEFLDNNPNIFCVGGWALVINHDNEEIDVMNYPPIKPHQVVQSLLNKKQNPMIDPSTMFRRADFDQLKGYTLNHDIYTVPDMDLWARAMIAGKKLMNIPEILIHYRRNENGMTEKHKQEMIKAHMQVWHGFARDFAQSLRRGVVNERSA